MFKMYLLYRIFKTLDSEIEDKINIFEFRLLLQLWAEVKRQGHGTVSLFQLNRTEDFLSIKNKEREEYFRSVNIVIEADLQPAEC